MITNDFERLVIDRLGQIANDVRDLREENHILRKEINTTREQLYLLKGTASAWGALISLVVSAAVNWFRH